MKNIFLSILALLYLILRFAFAHYVDQMGEFVWYFIEGALVIVSFILYRSQLWSLLKPKKALILYILLAPLFGFAVYRLALANQIFIPFDLESRLTIVLLILVGPVLEESLFRFFIWQGLENYLPVWLTGVISTLIFSYAHLHSIWYVPEEFHAFIIYQSIYTLLLGGVCSLMRGRYRSLYGAIAVHFGFNLGFYIGSLHLGLLMQQ